MFETTNQIYQIYIYNHCHVFSHFFGEKTINGILNNHMIVIYEYVNIHLHSIFLHWCHPGFSVIDQGALCQRASLLHPSRLERALRNINSQLWSVALSRYGAFLWGYPQILHVILDSSLNHPAIYLWKPPQYPQLLISNTMYPVESCATSHQLPPFHLSLAAYRGTSGPPNSTHSESAKVRDFLLRKKKRSVASPCRNSQLWCAEKWKSLEILQFFGD